jgi:hypothetical protein
MTSAERRSISLAALSGVSIIAWDADWDIRVGVADFPVQGCLAVARMTTHYH